MNYNEEYRTPRDRVSQSCGRGTQRPSCGCSQMPRITPLSMNSTECPHKEQMHMTETSPRDTSCGCNNRETKIMPSPFRNTVCTTIPVKEGCVDTYPVAMAYVPMQQWQELYDPISGLSHGTIFRQLDLEWYPTNCRKDTCK